MRRAVDGGFHATRAAGLEWLARIVHPDVASLDEEMRDVQIVAFDERDAAAELRIERARVDALQMMFADIVGRMRLAGKDDLHRAAARVQNARESIRIREYELGTFVAGET